MKSVIPSVGSSYLPSVLPEGAAYPLQLFAGGEAPPSDVERIQDVGFDTGTGWAGTGTVNTGAGTGTMTVGQTLVATFASPLVIGEDYVLTIGVQSGSIGSTAVFATLQGGQQVIVEGSPPIGPWPFTAAAASNTITFQTTDSGTLVFNSVSIIGP